MTIMTIHSGVRPYPRGVRPHFFEAAERRRELENDIFSTLRAAGYREIILPIVDSSEPYREVVDETSRRRSYRFVDREGDLLEIRSDFTPVVARSLAPMLESLDLPLRVSYRGDVVRCESGRLSDDGEFYQIGGELLGADEPHGDAELLGLAVAAVRAAGVEPSIVLSNEQLIERLLEELGSAARARIRQAVSDKHLDEVQRLSLGMREDRRGLLLAICSGIASSDGLRAAGFSSIADAMERIRSTIEDAAVSFAYDDIDPARSYYTGIRFKMFDESGRVEIARGGRYDDLYRQLGGAVPAVGFTLSLDRLEGLR